MSSRSALAAAGLLLALSASPTQVRQREGWYRTAVLGGWRPIAG